MGAECAAARMASSTEADGCNGRRLRSARWIRVRNWGFEGVDVSAIGVF